MIEMHLEGPIRKLSMNTIPIKDEHSKFEHPVLRLHKRKREGYIQEEKT